ncbi:MAG: hypothetical protein ACLFVQ_08720 [Chitinispirillaceae bacterium]
MIHDSPYVSVTDPLLLQRFLERFVIAPRASGEVLIRSVADAFSSIPYENLTKIIKSETIVSPSSAMRLPDELIGDYLRWGTGGTCFSLTAAIIAVYGALGIEAHPVLADRHYGPDTHCGVLIFHNCKLLLLDPGYLLFEPTVLCPTEPSLVQTGTNQIELKPLRNGEKVELYTVYKKNRKLRLTYKISPVDSVQFAKAWESSFAWEMMTYPVLTRRSNGHQQYLQGDKLAVFSQNDSKRTVLSKECRAELISTAFGIDQSVISRALGVIKNG